MVKPKKRITVTTWQRHTIDPVSHYREGLKHLTSNNYERAFEDFEYGCEMFELFFMKEVECWTDEIGLQYVMTIEQSGFAALSRNKYHDAFIRLQLCRSLRKTYHYETNDDALYWLGQSYLHIGNPQKALKYVLTFVTSPCIKSITRKDAIAALSTLEQLLPQVVNSISFRNRNKCESTESLKLLELCLEVSHFLIRAGVSQNKDNKLQQQQIFQLARDHIPFLKNESHRDADSTEAAVLQHLNNGNFDNAARIFRKTQLQYLYKSGSLSEGYTEALCQIGVCCFHSKDFPKAVKALSKSVTLKKTLGQDVTWQHSYYLGLSLFRIGATKLAIPHLCKCLSKPGVSSTNKSDQLLLEEAQTTLESIMEEIDPETAGHIFPGACHVVATRTTNEATAKKFRKWRTKGAQCCPCCNGDPMSNATVVHMTLPPKLVQSKNLSKEQLEQANKEAAKNARALLQEESINRKHRYPAKKKEDARELLQPQASVTHNTQPRTARNKKKNAKKNERKKLATAPVTVSEATMSEEDIEPEIAAHDGKEAGEHEEENATPEDTDNSTPEETSSSQDGNVNESADEDQQSDEEETSTSSRSCEGDVPPLAILRSMESCLIDKKKPFTIEQQATWDDLNNGAQTIDTHLKVFLAHSLGQGASSNVVLGLHQHRGFVAVKIITSNTKNTTVISRTIASEMKALRRGDEHHNVLRLLGHHEKGPRTFLVLELCSTDLWTFVKDPSLSWNLHPLCGDKIGIVKQICEGVKFLHSRGVLHRDLKPSNILISESGIIKIADFGFAKVIDSCDPSFSVFSEQQQDIGTRGWRAPEVIRSKKPQHEQRKPAADVFSVGLIAYFVFSGGQHPFGSTAKEQERNILKMKLPITLDLTDGGVENHFVRWCLAPDPSTRLSMAQALEHPLFLGQKDRLTYLTRAFREHTALLQKQPCDWQESMDDELFQTMKFSTYYPNLRGLLWCVRTLEQHYSDSMPIRNCLQRILELERVPTRNTS